MSGLRTRSLNALLPPLVAATKLAGQAGGRLTWGPRVGVTDVASYASQFPERWLEAHAAQPLPQRAARHWGDAEATWPLQDLPHPPLGLVDLSGGAIVGMAGWAVTDDHRLLRDVGWPDYRDVPELAPRRRYPGDQLSGTCLSIAAECAHDNYGHFLLDSLPRLGLASAAGFSPGQFDRIIASPLPPNIPVWLLERSGLDMGRLVFARMRRQITAMRLYATSFPGRPRDYPASTAAYLRSLLPADGAPRNRRLFVRRFGIRELANEAELLEIATRFGFEAYDYRESPDTPRDFSHATIIAGAHGATLANLAFCQPTTQVLEIIPDDHVEPYFMTLSRAAGLSYHYMIGRSASFRPKGATWPSRSPVHADPAVFAAALRALVDRECRSTGSLNRETGPA